MEIKRGQVAVVTGGGSGIGRGISLAAADEGMNVVVADIEEAAAERVAEEVRAKGGQAIASQTDVTSLEDVKETADRAFSEFDSVHLLCNNAGVSTFKPMVEQTPDDWRWVLSVNLDGVVNGILAFLPRLVEQSDESHIVSTASTAGLIPIPELGIGPYTASKYAIVGISEKLRGEVDGNGIGVSVLCPGGVRTNLMTSERNRPTELGGTGKASENILAGGKDPLEVGRLVLAGVKANQAYMFTDLTIEDAVEARFKAIKAGFAATRELLEKGV